MQPLVRLAEINDINELQTIDPWPPEQIWKQKISNKEVVVLVIDEQIAGLIRYALLWTTVPFIGLIEIKEEHRKKGYSILLLDFLKEHLRQQGFVALLSSSQTNEPTPQAWHSHVGFKSNGIIENIADDDIGEIVYRLEL